MLSSTNKLYAIRFCVNIAYALLANCGNLGYQNRSTILWWLKLQEIAPADGELCSPDKLRQEWAVPTWNEDRKTVKDNLYTWVKIRAISWTPTGN